MHWEDVSSATEKLFKERKDFIVMGLTGRTGSGCSTVARLLTQDFANLNPPLNPNEPVSDNEKRKYQVVYKYAKANWRGFTLIEMRTIITLFLIDNNFDTFVLYLEQCKDEINDYDKLIEFIKIHLEEDFNKFYRLRIALREEAEENKDAIINNDNIYNFYFKELPEFSKKIQDVLKNHQPNLYAFLYQMFGNNIRTSGEAYNSGFNPQNIFRLSQRTNKLIKILRKRNPQVKGSVLVVIDALRNPYEATFFKDRYSAFYLFSVNTKDKIRKDRLHNKEFNKEQIEKLDEQEYPEKSIGVEKFSSQNIQKCIELADIHLYSDGNDENLLKEQLIKYVSLIMHPGLITPTHVERCMQIAVDAKLNSGCLSRQVGAVITDANYSIKAVGWNSTPEGQITCNLRDLPSLLAKHNVELFSDFEINNSDFREFVSKKVEGKIVEDKLIGRTLSYCFKDVFNSFEKKKNQVHTRSLHAEENAFLQIVKYGGQAIKGGFLFTTASPCELCAKKAYQLGIEKIYYIDPYPGISDSHVLQCGKDRPELELFRGATGEAYNALYTPVIPFKDELYMLLGFKFEPEKKYE